MEYNSERPKMIIPEYGRNVQKMVKHCLTVADRDERNKVAQAIIGVMGQLNPHLRDIDDYKHKLWAHLFIMADFKLDVDSPYEIPTAETFQSKPDRIPYPQGKIRYGHYGKSIPQLIEKCVEYEEGDEKDTLTLIIANMMKKAYLTWNRDSVNDEVIAAQLKEMSNGKLELKDLTKLISTKEVLGNRRPTNDFKKSNNHRNHRNNNHRNNSNNRKFKKKY